MGHRGVQGRQCPYPVSLERIRRTEYQALKDTTYLDHAGATPYPQSTVKSYAKDLNSHLFGNPHSNSPSSALSTARVQAVRTSLLRFFKADEAHFDLIFVANATTAIKHVVHCLTDYCQANDSQLWYAYHQDSHTSLVGPREVAAQSSYFQSDAEVEEWLHGSNQIANFDCEKQVGLFAFPGQSNLTGRRLPLDWSGRVRTSIHKIHSNVFTLLDAAALASTAQIDLSNVQTAPDFTALSLYKIFGFPDLGVLVVRKDSGFLLSQRRYFGGGTVDMIINSRNRTADWVARKPHIHERHEDGTLPFHTILAVTSALAVHTRLYGCMSNISAHVSLLITHLYKGMRSLSHGNGRDLCKIYAGANPAYGDSKQQGPIIAFNLLDRNGNWIRKSDVEALAIAGGIQLRTGGVCNPGGIAESLSLSPSELRDNFAEGLRCGNDVDILGGKPTGVVRVSLGAMTTLADLRNLLKFLDTFVDRSPADSPSAAAVGTVVLSSESLGSDDDVALKPREVGVDPACDSDLRWYCPIAGCRRLLSCSDEAQAHFATHDSALTKRGGSWLSSVVKGCWRGHVQVK